MKNKNPEMTRHFEDIWRSHNDPKMKEKQMLKEKREKRVKDFAQDLGIYV